MFRIVATLILLCQTATAQLAIRNGVGIPTRDTLHILIVFAEVDFSDGPCSGGLTETFKGNWPKGRDGRTQVPGFAGDFLDTELTGTDGMNGFITRFYHEASFGQYVLLGDYLNEVVTIPCKEARTGNNGLTQVIERLAQTRPDDSTLHTSRGFPLSAFDRWTDTGQGKPKPKEPDGMIDLLYIIWRNNRMLTGPNTRDYAGYGVTSTKGKPFKDMQGVANMASFNASDNAKSGSHITIAEHLHGIFGGNHWHSAGGRGMHTFLIPPASYGLTAQAGGTMLAASGWDRWMMDWRPPGKNFAISALDTDRKEADTEWISLETHPQGGTFILRDHMATGDAIRIKLPFIDWEKDGDIKNQYLWLENRRMTAHSDLYLSADCANNGNGRFPRGTPGVYAYIQVGKDQREGDKGIYSSQPGHPNGLASPFFPLPAEGRFDFHFRYDRVQPGNTGISCNWGNENIPKDMRRSRPNPLTGHSDLYCQIDYNRDGKMYSGDRVNPGLSKMRGDSAVHDYHVSGDWLDAFSSATGSMELSLSTNPAPVTVYTYSSNLEYGRYGYRNGQVAAYENRTVWLNGLEIRFRELADGEMEVKLRWDGYDVKENVRWCGTIVQSPHVSDPESPSLRLAPRRRILFERGESPQYHEARGRDGRGEWQFADPTVYTVRSGAVMEIGERARLMVNDDSRLEFGEGSTLILAPRSRIVVAKGAELLLPENMAVKLGKGARIVRK